MKKYLLLLILPLAAVPCFAQFFDDLPYSNPDRWTYFQQEMTSLMRAQTENDGNIPFFLSSSVRFSTLKYKEHYIESLEGNSYYYPKDRYKGAEDLNLLLGVQTRQNSSLYYQSVVQLGMAMSYSQIEEYDVVYENPFGVSEVKTPAYMQKISGGVFMGVGVFLNTDIIKGGVYTGVGFIENNYETLSFPSPIPNVSTYGNPSPVTFRMALVPLVNTAGWAYVGRVLNNIAGYLGLGDIVVSSAEAEGDSKMRAFASSLNAALDFSFNRIDFGPLTLRSRVIYTRGNFDAAAKNNIYGLQLQGSFSGSRFAFGLEGGYKQFFSVSKYFLPDYPDTGYFNGSIFFSFQYVDAGIIYQYDNIYKSKVTFAVSSKFFSGYYTINPARQYRDFRILDDYLSFDFGVRLRGGWW
jgi:hypothetical protein